MGSWETFSILSLLLVIPLILLVGFTGNAFAQIATGSSGTATPHPDGPFDNAALGIIIPEVTLIACDPESSCPPILKQIDFSSLPINSMGANAIHEEFIIGQNGPEWWDWHERIITPQWEFIGTSIIKKVAKDDSCNTGINTFFELGNTPEIEYDFEGTIGGLNFGDKLCVWKDVQWIGSGTFSGILEIEEWPTIHKRQPVGGELIPIETSMVLLTGTHFIAAWLIPVIVSGIGFAIVIARKF